LTSRLGPRPRDARVEPVVQLRREPTPAGDADAAWRALFAVLAPGAAPRADAPMIQRRADAVAATDVDATQEIAARGVGGAGQPLPHLATLSASFGRHADALAGVRAHIGGEAAGAADAIGARAYATGTDIAFAATPDLHLAAHEAAHVVQQRAGVSLAGGVGAEGDMYEQHADRVAAAVVRGERAETILDEHVGGSAGDAVQRQVDAASTSLHVNLIGHASPRWEQTHGKDKHVLNKHLSQQRAAAVARGAELLPPPNIREAGDTG
jgi:hypothetical protein